LGKLKNQIRILEWRKCVLIQKSKAIW